MDTLIQEFFTWAKSSLSPLDMILLAGLSWSRYEIYRDRKTWNEGRELTLTQSAENAKVWNDLSVVLAGMQANISTIISLLSTQLSHRK